MAEIANTTQSDAEGDTRHKLREVWVPLGLVLFGGLWNSLATYFGDMLDEEDWLTYPIFAAFGALYVQPALCAVWGALSTQSWIWRLPSGTAACVFLALMMFGLGDLDDNLVFNLMMYLLCLGVLVVVRWRFKVRLGVADDSLLKRTRASSYDMRYLFLWTSIVALLAALGKMLTVTPLRWTLDIDEIAIWMFAFVLLFIPPVWLLAYLLRLERPRPLSVSLIFVATPFVSLVSCAAMWHLDPTVSFWIETYLPFSLICLGAMIAVAVVAALLRWAGYRTYRVSPS